MKFLAEKDDFCEHGRLGGVAAEVAEQIGKLTGKETRSLVLGHLQRGGAPVTADRLLAQRLGCAATRFLSRPGNESAMMAVRGPAILPVSLSEATAGLRTVPPDSEILQTGRDLGLCFGDEPPGTFLDASIAPPAG